MVLDLLVPEVVYFIGFDMTSKETFWQRDPRFQHLAWGGAAKRLHGAKGKHQTAQN